MHGCHSGHGPAVFCRILTFALRDLVYQNRERSECPGEPIHVSSAITSSVLQLFGLIPTRRYLAGVLDKATTIVHVGAFEAHTSYNDTLMCCKLPSHRPNIYVSQKMLGLEFVQHISHFPKMVARSDEITSCHSDSYLKPPDVFFSTLWSFPTLDLGVSPAFKTSTSYLQIFYETILRSRQRHTSIVLPEVENSDIVSRSVVGRTGAPTNEPSNVIHSE